MAGGKNLMTGLLVVVVVGALVVVVAATVVVGASSSALATTGAKNTVVINNPAIMTRLTICPPGVYPLFRVLRRLIFCNIFIACHSLFSMLI